MPLKEKEVQLKKPKYEARCRVCQLFRKDRVFRDRILLSTYSNPSGKEGVDEVLLAYGNIVSRSAVYRHLQNHQGLAKVSNIDAKVLAPGKAVAEALEGELITPEGYVAAPHEKFIDDIITEGSELLREGKLTLTTSQLLAAAKIKSDIVAKGKDRKLDALKTLFAGAAPQGPSGAQ